jgi:tetratricopeptide (TPR) repeat protein
MMRNAKFWYSMVVFQLLFGLAVFALTRDYYRDDADGGTTQPSMVQQPSSDWAGPTGPVAVPDMAQLGSQTAQSSLTEDPVEISRQAEAFFANKQYDKAATMYERLLPFSPNDGTVHNNLGLTLHYMGRSAQALSTLEEGVAIDPQNQRIWLTLGYVNSALGNTDRAREALTRAVETGTDEEIRQSARDMLKALP